MLFDKPSFLSILFPASLFTTALPAGFTEDLTRWEAPTACLLGLQVLSRFSQLVP